MSIRLVCANFLTLNCVQELAENELAIVSATRERISVEDRVLIGDKFQGGSERIDSYPPISLTHIVQELPQNELAIISATKECTSEEDRVVEDKFQDGGEKIDSYPGDPCLLSDAI